ncbi:MAG: DNA polymerase beta superfamily protein [Planctomycetota bacterium]
MASVVDCLARRGLIRPPAFLVSNVMYETLIGSRAYGVSGDESDRDVYGFAIPPKEDMFPHLAGEIVGFGTRRKPFDSFHQTHIHDPDALGGRGVTYDLTIYSIARYFTLCMECNPNLIDSLFTAQECVLTLTRVGAMVRDQRALFLHKGIWTRFKGYAYSQLHKMEGKAPIGKRVQIREQFGYDVKFAYHVVRLLYECEQLLMFGEMDLRRDREHLKAIRRGDVSVEDIRSWASEKERQLEKLYLVSKLPDQPNVFAIRNLLLNCLEEHYGNLSDAVARPDAAAQAMTEIAAVVDRYQATQRQELRP